jgi:KamA family protein
VSRTLELLARIIQRPVEELEEVSKKYPFALTPFVLDRLEEGTYSSAALRQFIPDIREMDEVHGFTIDPTGEGNHLSENSILQTYDNRLVIMLSYQCLVYCRFCVRKAFVGIPEHSITTEHLERALAYLENHPEVQDVILSGGDPLAVPNRRLLPFLDRLTAIGHIKVIRIDSRAISTMPKRIDDELLAYLEKDGRFWYHAHMNHPDDIDHREVIAAIRRLQRAGVPVMNQSVILAGVNDDPQTMVKLMSQCYYNKVMPYNLYLLDPVKGGAHFEVATERVIEICEALSHLPGPAQPTLIYVDTESKKHRAIYDEATDLRSFITAHKNLVPVTEGISGG